MQEQLLTTVTGLLRKRYTVMDEILETSRELSEALDRQDEVTVQLCLNLRQSPINAMRDVDAQLRRQCAEAAPEDGQALRDILNGTGQPEPGLEVLLLLAERNRTISQKVLELDRRINRRLGGSKSYYCQAPAR